jgi:nucleotidyltransferase substrate binding protein (TIGR01987 family)
MEQDIRWQQRFAHFQAALKKLNSALLIIKPSEVERAGIIQIFEFTAELAWNTLKDYLEYQGETDITGSRDAINLAFQRGMIADGLAWLEMLKSRNLSSHI